MRNFLRSIFATAAVALLATSGAVPTDAFAAPRAHAGNFDGSWSVVINTVRGDCGSGCAMACASSAAGWSVKMEAIRSRAPWRRTERSG